MVVNSNGVLILAETREGHLASISKEMMGIGGTLAAALSQPLNAVLIGKDNGDIANELAGFGASQVYSVDHPLLAEYSTDGYTAAMETVIKEANPSVVLMGLTTVGRDLAPRLAARLGVGLAMDCTGLEVDPQSKLLVQTRPLYGGNARGIYVSEKAMPQMATVRPKAFEEAQSQSDRQAQVVAVNVSLTPAQIRTRLVERVSDAQAGEGRVEEAQIVVAGGVGVGSRENLNRYIVELARVLGGVAATSRPVVDKEWTDHNWWIGLSGKIIAPNLYIAVGIHGASQHMAGCAGARNIVAINTDAKAPIFRYARFGIVGDCNDIMPVLIEQCREALQVKA